MQKVLGSPLLIRESIICQSIHQIDPSLKILATGRDTNPEANILGARRVEESMRSVGGYVKRGGLGCVCSGLEVQDFGFVLHGEFARQGCEGFGKGGVIM